MYWNLAIIIMLTPLLPTVLVPVASTVIPLDDLPQYKVGVGLGVSSLPSPGKFKPDGPVKLITSEYNSNMFVCHVW